MVFVNRTRSFPKGDELNFVISGGTPSVLFVYGQSIKWAPIGKTNRALA
jgi:hypothetical protein